MLTLDVACGENKRGDIGIDLLPAKDVDVICDAHHLPFKPNIFDEVNSTAFLEHSPNPLNALKEQFRVMNGASCLICETDNASFWRYHLKNTFFNQFHPNFWENHFTIYFPENVIRLFKALGIEPKWRWVKRQCKIDRFLTWLLPKSFEHLFYGRFVVWGAKVEH